VADSTVCAAALAALREQDVELPRLIAALSSPTAYRNAVEAIDVRQTHISVVFLAGQYAYKIKKPVALDFLDFSTLEKRRQACEAEVRLNRRLAPDVYLDVVPISVAGSSLAIERPGEIVEWAVKMERLPEDATLRARLLDGALTTRQLEAVARRIAAFHAGAEAGAPVSRFGRFEVVAQNARENFTQARPVVGVAVSPPVFRRLLFLTEEALDRLRPLIEGRAERGVPRDTHGDLRLDHVYLFPDRPPPGDIVVIDCIEFNERFRFADPISDVAFLVMDLKFHGRADLAQAFIDAYRRATSDDEGGALLPFYVAYRAVVRAKVEGFELAEREIPEVDRQAARLRAQAHWLLALGELEEPSRRPCLILVAGLPGAGKSTLAKGLAEHAGFKWIRSDVVRKELAGLPSNEPARSDFEEGIYGSAWTDRTYAECLHRAERRLLDGERVIVDASFVEERRRRPFLELAERLAIPARFMVCRANPNLIRDRLDQRRGDASDADWSVHQRAAARWEEFGPTARRVLASIDANGTPSQVLEQATKVLRDASLLD